MQKKLRFMVQWVRYAVSLFVIFSILVLMIGWGWAFAIRFIIGMVMIGLWLIWATL